MDSANSRMTIVDEPLDGGNQISLMTIQQADTSLCSLQVISYFVGIVITIAVNADAGATAFYDLPGYTEHCNLFVRAISRYIRVLN